MVGWDQGDPGEKFIACTGLFAGKPAKRPVQQPKVDQT